MSLVPKNDPNWPEIPEHWVNGAVERVYLDRQDGKWKADIYLDRSIKQMPPEGWTALGPEVSGTRRYRKTVEITEAGAIEWQLAENERIRKREARKNKD